MAPGEYISIASEKGYELLMDCGVREGSNFGRSIRIGIVKGYLFKFLYRLRHHLVLFYFQGLDLILHFHHGYIAFTRSHLTSAQLSHSIVGRELNHQVVG